MDGLEWLICTEGRMRRAWFLQLFVVARIYINTDKISYRKQSRHLGLNQKLPFATSLTGRSRKPVLSFLVSGFSFSLSLLISTTTGTVWVEASGCVGSLRAEKNFVSLLSTELLKFRLRSRNPYIKNNWIADNSWLICCILVLITAITLWLRKFMYFIYIQFSISASRLFSLH